MLTNADFSIVTALSSANSRPCRKHSTSIGSLEYVQILFACWAYCPSYSWRCGKLLQQNGGQWAQQASEEQTRNEGESLNIWWAVWWAAWILRRQVGFKVTPTCWWLSILWEILTYLFDIYTYFVLSKEVFSHYIKNNEENVWQLFYKCLSLPST